MPPVLAVVEGKMTFDRWISALLTYLIPYTVNIHGQFVANLRHHQTHCPDRDLSSTEPKSTSLPTPLLPIEEMKTS